ncbi:aromatic acid/H+ symport family MFS transporter [Pseudomonas sp. R37(2017)]|uniref:MFS transporter n=1 Tax=Pseudomonas sp. R37(2017) TaxID=1981685 RepID=UPI000A1D781D|nr:aromatic acid/H+ symport family MFS transporter [Pseudomonas sp. R37(2017)]
MSSTDKNNSVDVQDFIDSRPVSRYQWLVLGLCFLVTAIDGLDTAAVGFIAPALRDEWGLTSAQLNPVLGASLLGLMLGAFIAGPLADRFGRKTILLVSVLFFGGWSLAACASQDVFSLTLMRLLTGLGLGGAMPQAITLTSEYCPQRRRSLMVTTMFCGFTLGSAFGGVIAAQLVPVYGWRSVLLLGGLLPLACLPLLYLFLPESVRFLVQRQVAARKVSAILQRISGQQMASDLRYDIHDGIGESNTGQSPIRQILSGSHRTGTLLLWTSFFMSLLIIYMMTSWLPILVKDTGLTLSQAARVSAMFQVGGTLGAVVLGAAMDRFNPFRVLVCAYVAGAFCLMLIGLFHEQFIWLAVGVFGMGFCISGSQVGANALAASFYPTTMRSTGVSWAHGVGRIGSVLGTLSGGWMLGVGMGFNGIFSVLMLPALLAGTAIFVMGLRYSRSLTQPSLAVH